MPTQSQDPAAEPAAPPAQLRRAGAFVPYGGLRRRQDILGAHYPALWTEVAAKWVPTARPISQADIDNTGNYGRGQLSDILCKVEEWDGYTVCAALELLYGWRVDAALVAIIHRWACSLFALLKK